MTPSQGQLSLYTYLGLSHTPTVFGGGYVLKWKMPPVGFTWLLSVGFFYCWQYPNRIYRSRTGRRAPWKGGEAVDSSSTYF
jgi:hypothetical protein